MKATMLGAVVSDGLDSGKVVSGVGGQYDFVRQSFALKGARSIIMINAVRNSRGKRSSNVVWDYGHTTIPRHLRDIVVNEYGIADMRGASDKDVVAAMLSISDKQFQSALLKKAKANGKVDADFVLDSSWAKNSQASLEKKLNTFKQDGLLPDYPFGTDFTELEQRLIPVLEKLQQASSSKLDLFKLVVKGMKTNTTESDNEIIKRLGLEHPSSLKEKITRFTLLGVLHE